MVSSLTFGMLFAIAFRQGLTKTERKARKLLCIYFILMSFVWLYLQIYTFYDHTLKYFAPLMGFMLQINQVVFYHFMRILSPVEKNGPKHIEFHYIIPLMLLLASGVFMISYIFTEQLSDNAIATLFLPYVYLSSLFFSLYYSIIIARRIILYKKRIIQEYGEEKWKPMRWIELVVWLRVIFAVLFGIKLQVYHVYGFMAVLVPVQHIIIVYYMLMKSYTILPFGEKNALLVGGGEIITVYNEQLHEDPNIQEELKKEVQLLSRSEFEDYYKTYKPYLNLSFKIIDLVEYFKINRTYLSGFINQVYGVNFSQYNNLWRLKEVEYLQSLPEHKGKNQEELALLAGFNNPRSYWRAKKMAEQTKTN
ncbi:AraC family transcriptional regulator [Chryseobacterium rhizosphaerae]|nr:AraC family transcriptional regulator [Chryseobacterium rhizosphaerae]